MGGGAAFPGRPLGSATAGTGRRSPAGGAARAHGVRKALLVAGSTIGMAARMLMCWLACSRADRERTRNPQRNKRFGVSYCEIRRAQGSGDAASAAVTSANLG
jgi:hypothetical protein